MDKSTREQSVEHHTAGKWIWNALSMLVFAATIAIVILFILVALNPRVPFNPFPPPAITPSPVPQTASPSPKPSQITVRTATEIPTINPTVTQIITPTAIAATPYSSPVAKSPTQLNRGTASPFTYGVQSEPRAIDATLFDPNHGCTWMGVAGRAYDLHNSPAIRLEVKLTGEVNGKPVDETSLTGTAIQYGPSGFEFTLAEKPFPSYLNFSVRLVDQAGEPLSERIFFSTYSDCTKNLVIINFKQLR